MKIITQKQLILTKRSIRKIFNYTGVGGDNDA